MAVYVIGPKGGPYKIGVALHVYSRIRELQVGNWQKLVTHLTFDGRDDYALETYLHEVFAKKKIRGEWFDLNADDLKRIPEIVQAQGTHKKEKIITKAITRSFGKVSTSCEYEGEPFCKCGAEKSRKSKQCYACYLTRVGLA